MARDGMCACARTRDAGMLEEAGSVLQQLLTAAVKEGSFYNAARHALRVGLGALAQVTDKW